MPLRCRWISWWEAWPRCWPQRLCGIPAASRWRACPYPAGGFYLNALYVALGELIVLYTLGILLYLAMKRRHLDTRLFG